MPLGAYLLNVLLYGRARFRVCPLGKDPLMKRCLLVGAAPSGHKGLDHVLETQRFDAVYAVDGGYAALRERGIVPTKVFGDFDSLGYAPDHPCVSRYDAHKDFTDMDLAIQDAELSGCEELVLCDAFEGRLDHTLGNLQLLVQVAARGTCVWGVGEEFAVAPLVAPGPFAALSFAEGAQGTCSVINHSDVAVGVTEEGMEYGIENGTTLNRALWGVSNELVGAPARISLREGSLWVLFPLDALPLASYC